MFEDDLLFIECGGYVVPHLWEDGRLDFLSRRRFEAEAHYDRMIAQYEHELERIRCDLQRNPSDHSLHHMEDLYRNRLAEAKRTMSEHIRSFGATDASVPTRTLNSVHRSRIRSRGSLISFLSVM